MWEGQAMDACALLVARESKLGSGSDPGLAIIRFFLGWIVMRWGSNFTTGLSPKQQPVEWAKLASFHSV